MKTITVIEPSDVRYLRVDVGPRYWEDAIVDGNEDISFDAQAKGAKPLMPFAVFCEDTAKRCKADSYRWQLDIDLKELKIVDIQLFADGADGEGGTEECGMQSAECGMSEKGKSDVLDKKEERDILIDKTIKYLSDYDFKSNKYYK